MIIMIINILLTSAGRRVELIQEFIKAKNRKGIEGRIISADMNELAPALYFSDKAYKIPSITSPDFINTLLNICKSEQIRLLIPTIDTELEILSKNVNVFKEIGTDILVSSLDTVKIAQNKLETYKFFKSMGLNTPTTYGKNDNYDGGYPCFIKPLSGSSSINAFKVSNEREFEFFKYYIGEYVIQDFIEGEEYTIDVLCNFDGKPIYITPRIRLATRSGEVIKTKIVNDEKLIGDTKRIIEALKPNGPITIQAIHNKIDKKYYFIEINVRFGGGCPLSMMAGADMAGAIYDLLLGKCIEFSPYAAQEGLVFLRFDQSICLIQKADGHYEKN